MREVGQLNLGIPDEPPQRLNLLMRQFQERIEQAELVHDLQGRGMDRVAAEITEEISVPLDHDGSDAGARQQKPEHDSSRPAAGDAACRLQCVQIAIPVLPPAVLARGRRPNAPAANAPGRPSRAPAPRRRATSSARDAMTSSPPRRATLRRAAAVRIRAPTTAAASRRGCAGWRRPKTPPPPP